jgi:hypothetical protein
MEAEESTALKIISREWVKAANLEDLMLAVVNCTVCELSL